MGRTTFEVDEGIRLSALAFDADPTAADDASPVLLVHGLASNARTWEQVAARLVEAGHPVVAIDQRGHGLSDTPPDGYTIGRLAQDLVEVLDVLAGSDARWERTVVVGQSMGGNVALELAASDPRILGAVGVDGGLIDLRFAFARWEDALERLRPPEFGAVDPDEARRRIRALHPGWTEAGIDATLANLRKTDDGRLVRRLPLAHHLALLRSMWDTPPSAAIHRLGGRAAFLVAVDDDGRRRMSGLPVDRDPQVIAARAAGARLVSLVGDHDLHVERPDDVADAIRSHARSLTEAA